MTGRPDDHDPAVGPTATSVPAQRAPASQPTVSRRVMADVTWAYCRFPRRVESEEQVGNRHRKLLNELLAYDLGSQAGAWILHDPQLHEAEQAAQWWESKDPIFAPYRWFDHQKREAPQWRGGAGAQQTVQLIGSGLEQCGKVATRAWMQGQEPLLAAQMNLFACRIYLDPQQAARLVGQADPSAPNVHVCIDFRFKEHRCHYWLYTTLSVWTSRPSSLEYAPTTAKGSRLTMGPSKGTALHVWYAYAGALRKEFKARVLKHFPPAETKILGREHQPPRFWIASGPGLPSTPSTVDDINSDSLNALASVLLSVPDVRSAGVAPGVINEQMLMLRRFVPDNGGEFPCYLVVPIRETAVEQEDDARKLMGKLTDLEAAAAAELFDVVTNLDIYDSHLRVYKAVVNQAEEFWDQLALYLPLARGSRVHKLIELVHQTLLQGIADLDQVEIQANEAQQKVKQSANALNDEFDRMLTERPLPALPQAPSIRSSLTKTGYFDKAARRGDRFHRDAVQVQRRYKTLLEGITYAFDERRVRGTDVLQRVGLALAVLAGLFAFLPEVLNAIFSGMRYSSPLFRLGIIGTVGFVLSGFGMVLWMRRLGILGSRRFRRRYLRLKAFLADCATERLSRLRDSGWRRVRATLADQAADEGRAWDQFFAEWDDLDHNLARQCAELLDTLARDEGSQPAWGFRSPRLEDLAREVERWALKALLVSERPRQFWQFPLPRLTFLYRFYPMMGSEPLPDLSEARKPDIVSDSDLGLTVANQCSGRPEEIDEIKRWAQHQVGVSTSSRPSAGHFVKALDEVGLKAGMTRKDFEVMLKRMGQQLRQA